MLDKIVNGAIKGIFFVSAVYLGARYHEGILAIGDRIKEKILPSYVAESTRETYRREFDALRGSDPQLYNAVIITEFHRYGTVGLMSRRK